MCDLSVRVLARSVNVDGDDPDPPPELPFAQVSCMSSLNRKFSVSQVDGGTIIPGLHSVSFPRQLPEASGKRHF